MANLRLDPIAPRMSQSHLGITEIGQVAHVGEPKTSNSAHIPPAEDRRRRLSNRDNAEQIGSDSPYFGLHDGDRPVSGNHVNSLAPNCLQQESGP